MAWASVAPIAASVEATSAAPASFIALPRVITPVSRPTAKSSRGRPLPPSSLFVNNAIPPFLTTLHNNFAYILNNKRLLGKNASANTGWVCFIGYVVFESTAPTHRVRIWWILITLVEPHRKRGMRNAVICQSMSASASTEC